MATFGAPPGGRAEPKTGRRGQGWVNEQPCDGTRPGRSCGPSCCFPPLSCFQSFLTLRAISWMRNRGVFRFRRSCYQLCGGSAFEKDCLATHSFDLVMKSDMSLARCDNPEKPEQWGSIPRKFPIGPPQDAMRPTQALGVRPTDALFWTEFLFGLGNHEKSSSTTS